MKDRYVSAIEDFVDEQWFEPEAHWPEHWFNQRAYSRWAASEILRLLRSRKPDQDPEELASKFARKMDYLSTINTETRAMFSYARDAAHDIADVIRAMS